MTLRGADGLMDRLGAMSRATRTYPRGWGEEYVRVARPQIPAKTGKTRASVHVANADSDGAEITASSVAVMIDTGTKPHAIEPVRFEVVRFQSRGQTVFARKVDHPGTRAHPYRMRAAEEALRRHPLDEHFIDAWNRAD